MAQNFAKDFVDHRRFGSRPNRVAKLALDHAERALDVAPLVVVSHVFFLSKHKASEHFLKHATNSAGRVRLERYECSPTACGDFFKVLDAQISFVGRTFVDDKLTMRLLEESLRPCNKAAILNITFNSGSSVSTDISRPSSGWVGSSIGIILFSGYLVSDEYDYKRLEIIAPSEKTNRRPELADRANDDSAMVCREILQQVTSKPLVLTVSDETPSRRLDITNSQELEEKRYKENRLVSTCSVSFWSSELRLKRPKRSKAVGA